jgi:hypothetical protein
MSAATMDLSFQNLKRVIDAASRILDLEIYFYRNSDERYDLHILMSQMDEIVRRDNQHPLITGALMCIIKGIKSLFMAKISDSLSSFHLANSLCRRVDDTLSFSELAFLTRISMLSSLLLGNYFFSNIYHEWLIQREFFDAFQRLCESEIGCIVINDEFNPDILPRGKGHSHLTRISMLREICRINSLHWTYFREYCQIIASNHSIGDMLLVCNTDTYGLPNRPEANGNNIESRVSKKRKSLPISILNQDPVKVLCVCCGNTGKLYTTGKTLELF